MAGNSAEMKVKATMDNSDLKKKAKESKDALRDFAKVGEDAVSSLGQAFGINTGKVEQMMSAVRGLGENLSKSGNEGTAALGNLLKGVNGLTAGIAGLGIGAAIAGFQMLRDEAENFKQTVAGANMEMATAAYIDTYKQVIHDFNRDLGEGFANTESRWKKFWGTIGSNLKAGISTGAFVSAFGGDFDNELIKNYQNLLSEANSKAAEAERLSNNIYQTQRAISDASVEWARLEREIAEQKRIAYDKTVNTKTAQEALAKATELINQRYGEEAELRKTLADLQFEYNNLAESSVADIDKANQLRIQEESTVARMNNALRELSERQATLTKQAEDEAAARAEALRYLQQMQEERSKLENWGKEAREVSQINAPKAVAMNAPGLAIPIKPQIDETALVATVEQLQSMLSGAFASISESLGGLIGDLINGENAWGNFGSAALSAMADLAINVGKLCVATGAASLGIKKALELHPEVALVAGAALIALGTAVKSSLSNIASGNYSAAGGVATSTGSYGGGSTMVGAGLENRDLNIKVTGKVVASGNQLMVVLENEQKRRNHTT